MDLANPRFSEWPREPARPSASAGPKLRPSHLSYAAQSASKQEAQRRDCIGLYGGDVKVLSESLEYVQRTATQILNALGADDSSAPPD